MNDYFSTFAEEILAKFKRVSQLINHGPSIGTYRETLVKNFLSNYLSNRYNIYSGFVCDPQKKISSKQIDILIVDNNVSAPFLFKDESLVIVQPKSVVCAIEIKSHLSKKTFSNAIENCFSFKQLCPNKNFTLFAFKTTSKNLKTWSAWYKGISKKNIQDYPYAIYCFNWGWFNIVPLKYASEWGHYFMHPSERKHFDASILSCFLSSISKNIDIHTRVESNPYADYQVGTTRVLHGCFRFGEGLTEGEPKQF